MIQDLIFPSFKFCGSINLLRWEIYIKYVNNSAFVIKFVSKNPTMEAEGTGPVQHPSALGRFTPSLHPPLQSSPSLRTKSDV